MDTQQLRQLKPKLRKFLSNYPKTLSSPGFYGGYTPFSDSYLARRALVQVPSLFQPCRLGPRHLVPPPGKVDRHDRCPRSTLSWAVDDTLCRKRGLTLYGAGMHHDPLISSRSKRLVSWGHDWVVLCLIIASPSGLPPKSSPCPSPCGCTAIAKD